MVFALSGPRPDQAMKLATVKNGTRDGRLDGADASGQPMFGAIDQAYVRYNGSRESR